MMNIKSTELCTVLISSCDAYEELWYPFFTILSKEWSALSEYPIVLNTESKKFAYEGLNIKCLQLYSSRKKVRWGERLIRTLSCIDSKYIIFLLEDFFLTAKVEQNTIEQCIQYMEQDQNIAVFNFVPVLDKENRISDKYAGFEQRSQRGKWRLNTQAAIWRRDKLMSYIRPHESAWDWEIYGSERSSRYNEDFYVSMPKAPRVFQYEDTWGGAIHRGKWTPYAVDLCRKYGLDIDFDIRGYENEVPPYEKKIQIVEKSFLKRIFRPPFLKRVKEYIRMWLIEIPRGKVVRYKSLK